MPPNCTCLAVSGRGGGYICGFRLYMGTCGVLRGFATRYTPERTTNMHSWSSTLFLTPRLRKTITRYCSPKTKDALGKTLQDHRKQWLIGELTRLSVPAWSWSALKQASNMPAPFRGTDGCGSACGAHIWQNVNHHDACRVNSTGATKTGRSGMQRGQTPTRSATLRTPP